MKALVVAAGLSAVLAVSGGVGRPEGQVVTQQLHDQRRVLVTVLVEGVQLRDGVVEGLNGAGIINEGLRFEQKLVTLRVKLRVSLSKMVQK